MVWQYTPYNPFLLIATLMGLGLLPLIWRRREKPGGLMLLGCVAGAAAWSGAYALEMAGVGLATKLLWARVQYFGITAVPTLWLLFALQYGRSTTLQPRSWWWFAAEPLAILLLVWTNGAHRLYWRETGLVDGGGFEILVITPGPFYYAHVVYSYLALLIGTVLLLRGLLRRPREYRRLFGVILAGCLAPWIGNALYMFDLTPFPHLDLTPFAFTITGLAGLWGLKSYGLLDLVPMARYLLIEKIGYGILVLDERQRIVDINAAGRKILGRPEGGLVGLAIGEVLPQWTILDETQPEQGEIALGEGEDVRVCQVSLFGTGEVEEASSGYLMMLRDVTEEKRRTGEQLALRQLRDVIWEMEEADDIGRVLRAIGELLKSLGIPFAHCGINLLKSSGSAGRVLFTPHSLNLSGEVKVAAQDANAEPLTSIWHSGKPYYRPDLHAEDRHGERAGVRSAYGVVRSLIDVPFSHGTLALNSAEPDAFSAETVAFLEELAAVLSEAFHRNDDIRARQRYMVALEEEIDEHRRTEGELRRAKEEAEVAARVKSEFLANMSHEIRTPMNAILGMTELVLDSELTAMQRSYLEQAHQAADGLLELLDSLLELSRADSGRVQLEVGRFSLRDCLAGACRVIAPQAHRKGLALRYQIEERLEDGLMGDATRLRQVLLNLMGNAVKFTESGSVEVGVVVRERVADGLVLCFTVRDTGIGIPEEQQQSIFEVFTQADASVTRRYGGTGLGLAISSRLVELMGGGLWVESRPGEGSAFSFTMPFKLAEGEEDAEGLKGRSALLIGADEEELRTNARVLAELGVECRLVSGGGEAVETAREQGFDRVLIDCSAPDFDVPEMVRRLAVEGKVVSGRIALLTTYDRTFDAARYGTLELVGLLFKPVFPGEFVRLFERVEGEEGRRAERERKGYRVLLAEDTPANQRLVRAVLERHGHRVVVAGDGAEALRVFEAEERFDLILMDVQMPEMSGLEATAAIRAREVEQGGHVPIVALTAHALDGERERCLASGMDGFLAKPYRIEELLAAVEEAVGASGEKGEAEVQRQPALTRETALEQVEGDELLLEELVGTIRSAIPTSLQEIEEALREGDGERVRSCAHGFKSVLGLLGDSPAFAAAARLEEAGRKEDAGEMAAAKEELEGQVESFAGLLEEITTEGD